MQKCMSGKVHWVICVALIFIMSPARSQQFAHLPLQLNGNWFLQANTNEWVVGFYDKLVYFQNDFWQYKVVAKKENDIQLLLQKGKKSFALPVSITSDSTIKVTYNATILLLTNKRRRMAAWNDDEMLQSQKAGKDTVLIKGYVDNRSLTSKKLIEFRFNNVILGNIVVQTSQVDKDGQFNIRIPLRVPCAEMTIEFGRVFEYVFMRPGDTAIVYFDLLPYADAKTNDEIRNTNCNMVVAGTMGAFNNEYRDYKWYKKRWDDDVEQVKMIHESDQNKYREYELSKKRFADSLMTAYRAQFAMSNLLLKMIQETNKYHLANSLYRYRWLHEPDKEVSLSTGYLNLLDSFAADDKYAPLAAYEYDGFIRERLNMVTREHLWNSKKADSFVTVNSSLTKSLEYVQEHDKALTEELIKSIDSLKQSGASLTGSRGSFSIFIPARDSAETQRKMQQYEPLLRYLDESDYWAYSYSRMDLLYGLSQIDSLFPRGICRDYLIGHYIYSYFLKPRRLNPYDDVLNKLKTICSDTTIYTIISKENLQIKQEFDAQTYESLLALGSSEAKETYINKIARENKGKVIYIDIWATWCGPCIEQFPYSKELQKHFEGKPVAFIYLCADSDKNKWQSSIKKYGLSGQHFLLNSDEISLMRARYDFSSYPRYMIVNKDGRLVSSNSLRPQNKEALISIVEDLLK
jgi:thiol-disulfide isomerase/thioredoxin